MLYNSDQLVKTPKTLEGHAGLFLVNMGEDYVVMGCGMGGWAVGGRGGGQLYNFRENREIVVGR